MSSSRQLAAIMFTDIVGYTASMGEDEEKAFELLRKNRQIQKPLVEKFNGKWLKEIGDGVLASFTTVTDAVYCAKEIQETCLKEDNLKLRIGIHLGEVVFEGDDVFGDGVNIASRLETSAPTCGIWVSESVERNLQNKKGIETSFVREEHLKNVKKPVKIYEVKVGGVENSKQEEKKKLKASKLKKIVLVSLTIIIALFLVYYLYPDQGNNITTTQTADAGIQEISIAVLPFKNYSTDPILEPFCDAMTDAVISRLSKLEGMSKVTSTTSVMSYKQTQKTMPEIAAELRVTHILEANFQKSGNHVKINLQLIDGPSDDHFWSNEYNGEWGKGIFKIQAEVAENVARKLGAQITDSEIKSIQKVPTNNEEAYNLFIQAEYQLNKFNEGAFENAIPLYEKAIKLDSNFTEAYLGLAVIWGTGGLVWGIYNEREAWKKTKELLQKALKIDSTNVSIYNQLYSGYFYYDWDFALAEKYYQTILHKPISHKNGGILVDYPIKTGRYNEALEQINKLILFEPSVGNSYAFKAEILMLQGKKKEAIEFLESKDPLYSDDWFYLREAAKHYYYLGEHEKARSRLNRMMVNFPDEDPPSLLWLNTVYSQMDGNNENAAMYLSQLRERYQEIGSGSPAWFMAMYYCHIEDYEKAFEWLQKSYDRHEVEMTWLREEPLLIPVRDDPRYKALYKKIGFPG